MPRPASRGHRLPVVLGLTLVPVAALLVCSVALAAPGDLAAGNLFESFMNSQVADHARQHQQQLMSECLNLALVPSPLAPEVQASRVRELMDSLAGRLLAASERSPEGQELQAALAQSLGLRQAIAEGTAATAPGGRSLHEELGLDPRARASRNLWASVQAPHLRSALAAYDFSQSIDLGARLERRARALDELRRRGGGGDGGEQLARQVAHEVDATLAELPAAEQIRLREATREAYGLEKRAADGEEGRAAGREADAHTEEEAEAKASQGEAGDRYLSPAPRPQGLGQRIGFGVRALMGLAERTLEVGLGLFDRFAATSEFLYLVPHVGGKLLELRARGEPALKLVERLRKLHYLFKVSRCPRGARANELVGGLAPELSAQGKFCRDHYDAGRVEATERIISEPAARALATLAKRMVLGARREDENAHGGAEGAANDLPASLTSGLIDELTSRATYALLAYALPAVSATGTC